MSKAKVIHAEDLTLPKPDEFGNYWWGMKLTHDSPALLRSSIDGRYLVMFNGNDGFAHGMTPQGDKLLKLTNVEEALKALNLWRRGRRRNAR